MMLFRTPLYQWHVDHGAKMTAFAGWEMPLHYGSILAEHKATRSAAGIFDLCHMARIRLQGEEREAFLDSLLPLSITRLRNGQVGYSFFCEERGGVIDDVTLYRADDFTMIVANGINRNAVLEWLEKHKGQHKVAIEDATESLGMIAIQGPLAQSILQSLTTQDLQQIPYYHFGLFPVAGSRALVSRTGYTGEDGFEVYCGRMYLAALWERLIEAGRSPGLMPVGLGARDLLRLEAGMPLYGHELSLMTTPLEAGLEKFVDFEKRQFIGKRSLMHSSSTEFSRRLIGFAMMDSSIPRAEASIHFNELPIGVVTSGAFSPTLGRGIGMGYIDAIKADPGTLISIDIRGKTHPAQIVKRPFYRRPKAQ